MTDNETKANVLSKSAIFRDLPKDALDAISRTVEHLVVPQNTLIFKEGDPGDSLYIISSGRARIFRKDESGMEIDLSIQGPGETFGEMALLTGEPRSADVEVLEETHLLVLSKDHFDRILREFPELSKMFVKEMRRWLLRDEKRIEMGAREAYNASRLSWLDFFVVIAISAILAVVFNYSNPNGIPLFPHFPNKDSVPVITPSALLEEVQRNETVLLDAMPSNFFQKQHIKSAINMPLGLFDIVYMMTFPEEEKEKKIVVYGRSVSRLYDLEVANKLLLRGHRNVRILEGGLAAWEQKGYPVEEKAKK
jgi:rhodanese-related sulfurtransferase